MSAPSAADLLQFARLMNGECEKCGRILPHPESGKKHECRKELRRELRRPPANTQGVEE